MILDSQLIFSNDQDLAITTTTPSTNVIDLLGGVSVNFGPNASRFGADMGIGDGVAMPKLLVVVSEALTTTNSATLAIAFQGSTDSSTWDEYMRTPAMAAADLALGNIIARMDWPPRAIGKSLPRYHRLSYIPATGVFSTGTLFAGIVLQRDDWDLKYLPSGFKVAG